MSAARERLAFGIGRRRAIRLPNGSAFVRSTATMCAGRMSLGNSATVSATLFQTIATRAPWSSNWCRSSGGV